MLKKSQPSHIVVTLCPDACLCVEKRGGKKDIPGLPRMLLIAEPSLVFSDGIAASTSLLHCFVREGWSKKKGTP